MGRGTCVSWHLVGRRRGRAIHSKSCESADFDVTQAGNPDNLDGILNYVISTKPSAWKRNIQVASRIADVREV